MSNNFLYLAFDINIKFFQIYCFLKNHVDMDNEKLKLKKKINMQCFQLKNQIYLNMDYTNIFKPLLNFF